QVATPQNLYDKPSNKFVAGFIGSPQMNFLNVTIRRRDGGFAAVFGDWALEIPAEKTNSGVFDPYVDQMVVMGVRPEAIADATFEPHDRVFSQLPATVDIAEMMGSEIYLYLTCVDASMIAKVSSHTAYHSGDAVKIALNMAQAHFFDAQTDQTICN
ncbi:MAG: TOBE domain-containing protein, partial [Oscillospiraceae bacterium]